LKYKKLFEVHMEIIAKPSGFAGNTGFRALRGFAITSCVLKIALMFAVLLFPGCGYRVRSAAGQLPGGAESIGIPTFRNLTGEAEIEQILTRAILREFAARTRGRVNSSDSGADLVLLGEVKDVTAVPVTFGAQNSGELTFSSAFQITVRIRARLVRQRDSAVVWEDENFVFRERHLINSDVRDYFAGDNPAFERLARNFAAVLAGAVLNRADNIP
jgi:outer membrane lipopolysaccharide assembly protein LptE/RlpB